MVVSPAVERGRENPYHSYAADVVHALLKGLADLPSGVERDKECAKRREEVKQGTDQIWNLLSATWQTLGEEEGDPGMQWKLCSGRLQWASDMTLALQQGIMALRLFEQCCAAYEMHSPAKKRSSWFCSRGGLQELQEREEADNRAAYRGMVLDLHECQARIDYIHRKLDSVGATPPEWRVTHRTRGKNNLRSSSPGRCHGFRGSDGSPRSRTTPRHGARTDSKPEDFFTALFGGAMFLPGVSSMLAVLVWMFMPISRIVPI